MDRTRTPGEHWDEQQMERDTKGAPVDKTQADVWNRHQMETDDGASQEDRLDRPAVDETSDAGGLSGHGQPSGESHWDRVDPKR